MRGPRGAPQPQGPGRARPDLAAGSRLDGARQQFQDRGAARSWRRVRWPHGHCVPLFSPPRPCLGALFDVSHGVAIIDGSAEIVMPRHRALPILFRIRAESAWMVRIRRIFHCDGNSPNCINGRCASWLLHRLPNISSVPMQEPICIKISLIANPPVLRGKTRS